MWGYDLVLSVLFVCNVRSMFTTCLRWVDSVFLCLKCPPLLLLVSSCFTHAVPCHTVCVTCVSALGNIETLCPFRNVNYNTCSILYLLTEKSDHFSSEHACSWYVYILKFLFCFLLFVYAFKFIFILIYRSFVRIENTPNKSFIMF